MVLDGPAWYLARLYASNYTARIPWIRYFHTYMKVTRAVAIRMTRFIEAQSCLAPPLLLRTQLVLYRIACQLGNSVQIEFSHQISSVGHHGGRRDLQLLCDLRRCTPGSDELKDLTLTGADARRPARFT